MVPVFVTVVMLAAEKFDIPYEDLLMTPSLIAEDMDPPNCITPEPVVLPDGLK